MEDTTQPVCRICGHPGFCQDDCCPAHKHVYTFAESITHMPMRERMQALVDEGECETLDEARVFLQDMAGEACLQVLRDIRIPLQYEIVDNIDGT